MSQLFPKPYEPYRGNVKVQLDLSNQATKLDLKGEMMIHLIQEKKQIQLV